jgi:flagellum-specific ATP synthase
MGSITGLFTVPVEGDDTNEPVSGAVRGILDRHIVLDQGIAGGGRFSAVDIPRNLSRSAAACYLPEERSLAREARRLMRAYAEMADLVRLDAYKGGSNPELDAAIAARPALEALLRQELDETAQPGGGVCEARAHPGEAGAGFRGQAQRVKQSGSGRLCQARRAAPEVG